MGWDWLFSTIPYGSWWKQHRTLFHQYFNTTTAPIYHPVQYKETCVMLHNLLTTPDNLAYHIRRFALPLPQSRPRVLTLWPTERLRLLLCRLSTVTR